MKSATKRACKLHKQMSNCGYQIFQDYYIVLPTFLSISNSDLLPGRANLEKDAPS
jgi:hypothetical protein